MTNESPTDRLPADLRFVETYLRSDGAGAPPALLARVLATRAAATADASPRQASPPRAGSRVRRRLLLLGAPALAAMSLWWLRPRERLPATQPASPPMSPLASDGAVREISRLLQPWPTLAQAQRPAMDGIERGPTAPLFFGERARLTRSQRTYRRVVRDVEGRTVSASTISVTLDSIGYRGRGQWLLVTRLGDGGASDSVQVDSIALAATTLMAEQRRLHLPGVHQYFRYTPRNVFATTTRPEVFFEEVFATAQRPPWQAPPSDAFSGYLIRPLDPRRALVLSEAHLQLLLRTAALFTGWSLRGELLGSLEQLTLIDSEVRIRVTGIDTLDGPGGRAPCHRVEIDAGARPDVWWISVATGEFMRGVRTLSDPTRTEVTTLESVGPLPRRR